MWALIGLAGLAVGTTLQSRVGTEAGAAAIASVEVAAGFAVLAVWAPLQGDVALPLTESGLASFAWLAVVAGLGAPLLLFARPRAGDRSEPPVRRPAITAVGLAIVVVALMLTTGRLVPASVRQAAPATPEGSPARSWSGSPRSCCGRR